MFRQKSMRSAIFVRSTRIKLREPMVYDWPVDTLASAFSHIARYSLASSRVMAGIVCVSKKKAALPDGLCQIVTPLDMTPRLRVRTA